LIKPAATVKEQDVGDARNALSSRDSHIWTLRISLLLTFTLLIAVVYILYQRQSDITVHVPPDLSQGAVLKPGTLQRPNVYVFANYVWRGLNDWTDSGRTDYSNNIERFRCLITPDFEKWLRNNYDYKRRQGELDRTRLLTEQALVAYDNAFVTPVGANVYSVAMVMQLQERVGGMVIKDVMMNYSLRVVPDRRTCNKMGMAIDGFMIDPTRAEDDAEKKSKLMRNKS
jgi:integrating conjugative element protein (TIGR03746 family)